MYFSIDNIISSDHETEGVWRNYYTGEKVDLSFAAASDLDGGEVQNCAVLVGPWNGWSDWTCIVPKVLNTKNKSYDNSVKL